MVMVPPGAKALSTATPVVDWDAGTERTRRATAATASAQLLPLRMNEMAVRRDAVAHARRAAADLSLELRAQRLREPRPDVGDLGPHLRLRLLALGRDDEEPERRDHA